MSNYTQVPELSLSDFLLPERKAAFGEELIAGLKYYGFIILRDHGIAEELLDQAYALSEQFFQQPESEKAKYFVKGEAYQRGFVPFGREHAKDNPYPDLKEMWHLGREPSAEHPYAADYPKNVWPSYPAEFSQVFKELYLALDAVGQQVLEALTPGLDVPSNYFNELASGGNSLMRILHYPPLGEGVDPNCVRAAAHEDINLITLLVAASSSGLELLDRDGSWLPVNGSPNAIIVDAGDMLARITNNVIPATTHRVVNPTGPNTARYSMPFFLHPKPDSVLACIESCKDGNEQEPITADEFLTQRLHEIGFKTA